MFSPVTLAMLRDACSATCSVISCEPAFSDYKWLFSAHDQLLVNMHCVILVLFAAPHQTSAAVTTSPATTDTTASTTASTGLQSFIPGN